MLPNTHPPRLRDACRGIYFWVGFVMAIVGWGAITCGSNNSGFATMLFLGAFQAGMGAMANIWMQARADDAAEKP